MAKRELKLRAVVSPTETVVVSAYDEEGRPQACTLAFYMVSSHVPPCVTVAINASQRRKTLEAMLSSGAFVLGFPSVEQVVEADYLGVESGYVTDKLANIIATEVCECIGTALATVVYLARQASSFHLPLPPLPPPPSVSHLVASSLVPSLISPARAASAFLIAALCGKSGSL